MTEEQLKCSTLSQLLGLKSLVFLYSKRTGENESENMNQINAELESRYTGEVTEEEVFWYIKEYITNLENDAQKLSAFIERVKGEIKKL